MEHSENLGNDEIAYPHKYIGLKNLLFSLINRGEAGSSDYEIAMYLLKNYHRINQLNIYDMATECYVNRTTIMRFFNKYGYRNFREFKSQYSDLFDEREYKPLPFHTYPEYLNDLNAKLITMMNLFNTGRDKSKEIDDSLEAIHQSERMVLMGDDSVYGQLYNAQHKLLGCGKLIQIITDNVYDNKLLHSLTATDLIMVFSLTGTYADLIYGEIQNSPAYKVLITMAVTERMQQRFDYVNPLTSHPEEADPDIFRRYGFTYFVDTMVSTYRMKYVK